MSTTDCGDAQEAGARAGKIRLSIEMYSVVCSVEQGWCRVLVFLMVHSLRIPVPSYARACAAYAATGALLKHRAWNKVGVGF